MNSNTNKINLTQKTYNKPIIISIKKGSSNYKASPCSTKYNSNEQHQSNNFSNTIDYFDYEDKSNKNSLNYFSKCLNTSVCDSEDFNFYYETLSPTKEKGITLSAEDKEQFTPYLGQKMTIDNLSKRHNSRNKFLLTGNNNDIRQKIESASLNLQDHFEVQLSNKYKKINKFQKLSFYQKKNINKEKNFLYRKKPNKFKFVKTPSQREKAKTVDDKFNPKIIDLFKNELSENFAILIQSVFRGYICRIKLYNKLKKYTCLTIFNQILNNIFFRNNNNKLKSAFEAIKSCNKKINTNQYTMSFIIQRTDSNNKVLFGEIKELTFQNLVDFENFVKEKGIKICYNKNKSEINELKKDIKMNEELKEKIKNKNDYHSI